MNKHDRAIEDFNTLISLTPESSSAHHLRGVSHGKLGDYTSALYDLNAAIALDPDNADLFRTRGLAHGHLRRHESALADFSECLRREPSNASALRDRGCIYVHMKRYREAIQDLSGAISRRPEDMEAYHNRALALYNLGRYESSIADSLQVLEVNPHDGDALLDIGRSYLKLNRAKDAISYLVDAVKEKPRHANSVKTLLFKLLHFYDVENVINKSNAHKSADTNDVFKSPRADHKGDRRERRVSESDINFKAFDESTEDKAQTHTSKEHDQGLSEHFNDIGDEFAEESSQHVDNTNQHSAEKKRKAMLKQMLASQRLKEYRHRNIAAMKKDKKNDVSNGHDIHEAGDIPAAPSNQTQKDEESAESEQEIAKRVRARQAVAAIEVERRAEQAVRLKRDLDESFARRKSKEHALKELIDMEVTRWKTKVKSRARQTLPLRENLDVHTFRRLIQALPKILPNLPAMQRVCDRCAKLDMHPKKAFRQVALELHPDKLDADLPLKESMLAQAAWCVITDAYGTAIRHVK